MRVAGVAVVGLALAFAVACGGKVSEGSTTDGGPTGDGGTSDCAKYCDILSGPGCTAAGKLDTCLKGCADSLSSCDAQTRAFLTCALQPGVVTCEFSSSKLFAACGASISALAACSGVDPGGGGSSGGGGVDDPSPGSSGSAP